MHIYVAERYLLITFECLGSYRPDLPFSEETCPFGGKFEIIFTLVFRIRSHVYDFACHVVYGYVEVYRHVGKYAPEPCDETRRLDVETRTLEYRVEIDRVEQTHDTVKTLGVDPYAVYGVSVHHRFGRGSEHVEKQVEYRIDIHTHDVYAAEKIAKHLGHAVGEREYIIHVEIFEHDAAHLGRPDVEHPVYHIYAYRLRARTVRKFDGKLVFLFAGYVCFQRDARSVAVSVFTAAFECERIRSLVLQSRKDHFQSVQRIARRLGYPDRGQRRVRRPCDVRPAVCILAVGPPCENAILLDRRILRKVERVARIESDVRPQRTRESAAVVFQRYLDLHFVFASRKACRKHDHENERCKDDRRRFSEPAHSSSPLCLLCCRCFSRRERIY